MTVTERLMGVGQWGVSLSSDTPGHILDQVSLKRFGFGHIVVTPSPLSPRVVSDATMLSSARFVGRYTSQPSEFEMGGDHVNAWMGDSGGKGYSFSSTSTPGTGTFADWRSNILTKCADVGIGTGVTGAISGTFAKVFGRGIVRDLLDGVSTRFGAEWVVTPSFKLNFGPPSALFRMTPNAVMVRHDGGRDLNVNGLMGDIQLSRDLEDYATRVVLFSGADGSAADAISSPVADADRPYRGPNGGWARIDRIVTNTSSASAADVALAEYNKTASVHQEIRLSSTEYDIAGTVNVGDMLWVFDQERDLYNTANTLIYRGQTIYPEAIRCVGLSWPIRQGMGVYFRRWIDDGTDSWDVDWVDLTEFVEFENSATTVEVGSKPRKI